MALMAPRTHASPVTRPALPRSPQRTAMVMLGSIVLGASVLGTIVGHLLSASPI